MDVVLVIELYEPCRILITRPNKNKKLLILNKRSKCREDSPLIADISTHLRYLHIRLLYEHTRRSNNAKTFVFISRARFWGRTRPYWPRNIYGKQPPPVSAQTASVPAIWALQYELETYSCFKIQYARAYFGRTEVSA